MRNTAAIILALALLVSFGWPAAPAFAGEATGSVYVNVSVLNVRQGPGTSYPIAGRVSLGSELAVQGANAAGDWLQVSAPGSLKGWVSRPLVSTAAPRVSSDPDRIVAPSIRLNARVVRSGWRDVRGADGIVRSEWVVPAFAAGWFVSSARPGEGGNVVLSGHHNIEGEVFRYVVNLKVGDTITLHSGARTHAYRVDQRMILPEKYVSYEQKLQNARWIGPFDEERLTLVTCWPYNNNTHRVIVVAHPVK